jgi:hypothetical protein
MCYGLSIIILPGFLLPYADDEVNVTQALHHHGEEPERPGYTLQELLKLSRSSVLQQRVVALTTLANILNKVMPNVILFLIVGECILLLYVISQILTFIPYSQLVLCMYTSYSLLHDMFWLHRAILR